MVVRIQKSFIARTAAEKRWQAKRRRRNDLHIRAELIIEDCRKLLQGAWRALHKP